MRPTSTAAALFNATGKVGRDRRRAEQGRDAGDATIDDSTVTAAGELAVTARDEAGVYSNIKIVSSSITTNDGGTEVLQDEINNFLDVDYISTDVVRACSSATGCGSWPTRRPTTSSRAPSTCGWARTGRGRPDGTRTTPTSASGSRSRETTLVPQGINFTNSDSMGIGAAIVLNDVSSVVEASSTDVGRDGGAASRSRRSRRRRSSRAPTSPARPPAARRSPARASHSRPAA